MTSKQQTLRKLMSMVDEYKDTIKEGDYLEICTLLRNMWNQEASLPDNEALRKLRVKRYYEMYDRMRMLQKYRVSDDFNPSNTTITDNEIRRLGRALILLQPYINVHRG
jgi:hypothetical protein